MKKGNAILAGIAAGLFASWIKSISEPPLQKIGLAMFPPEDGELELKGADIVGHPENMPPAVLMKDVHQQVFGTTLSNKEAVTFMPYIHYGLGVIIAISYVFSKNKNKNVGAFAGIPAGLAVFTLTHGSVIPALNLQGKVKEMPKSWWVWEFGSHLLFGLTLEQSVKFLNK